MVTAGNEPKLPLDIQAFEIMRGENYRYVDKTRHVYQMAAGGRYDFLSRPRRFGKSLLVSTLKCLFQGRKELFEGLWIAEHGDWEWQEHPVITIDFSEIAAVVRSLVPRCCACPAYLAREDFEAFFEAVQAIFASIPYDIESKRDEAYFHTIFYLILSATGVEAHSSVLTCQGKLDLAVRIAETVYIFEFKCNQSAETAIQQIRDTQYADRYRGSGASIVLVGVNFSPETRNVAEWTVHKET